MTTFSSQTPAAEDDSSLQHLVQHYADGFLNAPTWHFPIDREWHAFDARAVVQALSDGEEAQLRQAVEDGFLAETEDQRQASDAQAQQVLQAAFKVDRNVVLDTAPAQWVTPDTVDAQIASMSGALAASPDADEDQDQDQNTAGERFHEAHILSSQVQTHNGSIAVAQTDAVL